MKIIDPLTGQEPEIPPQGSLGLLALGDIAVKPWRERRIATGYEAELRARLAEQRKRMEQQREARKRQQRNQGSPNDKLAPTDAL